MSFEPNDLSRRVDATSTNCDSLGEIALRRLLGQASHVLATYRMFGQTVDIVAIAQRIANQQGLGRVNAAQIRAFQRSVSDGFVPGD